MTPLTNPIVNFHKDISALQSYDSDSVASENQSRLYFRSRDILTIANHGNLPSLTSMNVLRSCWLFMIAWANHALFGEKTWKWKKTPTKTTKLPIILNNFKLCPFNLEIVKNGWKETCIWFTLKLEFFLTLFFKIFRVLGKLKRIHIRIHPPRPWFLQAERYANGNPS